MQGDAGSVVDLLFTKPDENRERRRWPVWWPAARDRGLCPPHMVLELEGERQAVTDHAGLHG
jgi:hypothetical protein